MPTKFGRLAELRKALRMDLEQLAAASGVPLSTLRKISSGHKISARRQPCGTKERKRSEKRGISCPYYSIKSQRGQ